MDAIKFFSEWSDVPYEDAKEGYGSEYVEMIEEFARLEVEEELQGIYKLLQDKLGVLEELLEEQPDKHSIMSKIVGLQGIMIEVQTRLIKRKK